MSTALSLHHVGEIILRGLLASLADRDRLGHVPCRLHSNCTLPLVVKAAGVVAPLRFEVNAALAPIARDGREVLFDGAHGVDVLCHDGQRGLGIEAKLGVDRVSKAAFTERFLGPLKLSAHKAPRFAGSMTAILNHRDLGEGDGRLALHTKVPPVSLATPWVLVIRAATWRAWGGEPPELSNAHVVVFEEIAGAHGDAGAFDRLVLEVVGSGFHAAWKVGE